MKKLNRKSFLRFFRHQISYRWLELTANLELSKSNLRVLSSRKSQFFFGYYDVSPFSRDDQLLLACKVGRNTNSPHELSPVMEVGYFELNDKKPQFRKLDETYTWNWQQGCRLQFMPDNRSVIFNVLNENGYGSKIVNLETGNIKKEIPFPIYKISPGGKSALTLNFSRLHRLRRGYGYHQVSDNTAGDDIPADDGLFIANIETAETKLLFSLKQLSQLQPVQGMESSTHYLNHLDFSPLGTRLCFMHLWLSPQGKRYNRIIICDHDGRNIIIPTNYGHASHHCWQSENEILIFCKNGCETPRYHLFNLSEGISEVVGAHELIEDGHPSFIEANLLLTDTYPDKNRFQALLKFDKTRNKLVQIRRFFMPVKFTKELRCDLHPRLNHHKDKICVDIIKDNKRAICVVPLN